MQEANGWMKSRSLEEGQVMEEKRGTAGRGAREGGWIYHHSHAALDHSLFCEMDNESQGFRA